MDHSSVIAEVNFRRKTSVATLIFVAEIHVSSHRFKYKTALN